MTRGGSGRDYIQFSLSQTSISTSNKETEVYVLIYRHSIILVCMVAEAIRCARLISTNHFAIFYSVGTPTYACPVNKIINLSHATFQWCHVFCCIV